MRRARALVMRAVCLMRSSGLARIARVAVLLLTRSRRATAVQRQMWTLPGMVEALGLAARATRSRKTSRRRRTTTQAPRTPHLRALGRPRPLLLPCTCPCAWFCAPANLRPPPCAGVRAGRSGTGPSTSTWSPMSGRWVPVCVPVCALLAHPSPQAAQCVSAQEQGQQPPDAAGGALAARGS